MTALARSWIILLLLASTAVPAIALTQSAPVAEPHGQLRGALIVLGPTLSPTQRNFTVYVGRTGFNSTGDAGITLTVNEGDTVTIRFVYNDTSYPVNNPHDLHIHGYNLYVDLDRYTPEQTLTFTANIAGQMGFECHITNCMGHRYLITGVLDVIPYVGSRMMTSLQLSGKTNFDNVTLDAKVLDESGLGVPAVIVRFYRNSTWGFAQIDETATDTTGQASMKYVPPSGGDIVFKAVFGGSGRYASSFDMLTVHYEKPPADDGFPFSWGQNDMVDTRTVGVPLSAGLSWIGLILVIVGSVWATYGYVARQLFGVWSKGRKEMSELSKRGPDAGLVGTGPAPSGAQISYPLALVTGVGMVTLGFGSFLAMTLLVPALALLLFLPAAIAEAVVAVKLLRHLS